MIKLKFFLIIAIVPVYIHCFDSYDKILRLRENDFLGTLMNTYRIMHLICETVKVDKDPIDINELSFNLITTNSSKRFNISSGAGSILKSPEFDINKKTTIFIPGFTSKPDNSIFIFLARNFTSVLGHNYMILNYTKYSDGDYFKLVKLVPHIGDVVLDFISGLISGGVPFEKLYIIGYSIGAQIGGHIGRNFKKRYNKKMKRITGLDPASPCFNVGKAESLSSDDAMFVDVIHSSIYSFHESIIGHADYYLNGRTGYHPKCQSMNFQILLTCPHRMSVMVYTETVYSDKPFIGVECSKSSIYELDCKNDSVSVMGYSSSPNSRGVYYLNINDMPPFSLG